MKYLDRFINYIFSLFILALSGVVALIAAGIWEYEYVSGQMGDFLFSNENRTITCIVAIVVFFMALKTTIFLSVGPKKKKNVVYVDTNNGKVQIAQETIENTARSTVMQYDCVKDAKARMMKAKKGVDIYMLLYVLNDTNIMELTSRAQDEVKNAVEGSTGVKVNNVDIQIKNTNGSKVKAKTKTEEKPNEETNAFVDSSTSNIQTTAEVDIPHEELTEVVPIPDEGVSSESNGTTME